MTSTQSRFGAIPLSPININPSSRAVDKCLEEAQDTGEVLLSGRQLKEYPKNSAKYDLSCILTIDLSRNRLSEFPQQLETLASSESLNLSHNVLRSLPSTLARLSNLVCLNLNCNFLTTLPPSLGKLSSLEILLISNNKLISIPEEICRLQKLMQLDVSCNHLAHLPPQLGQISSLQSLNLRQNLLVELPTSIGLLNLKFLDFSSNRVARIPVEFGRMESLEVMRSEKNPLVSPPANVCSKGLVHVLKLLNNEAAKDERRRSYLNVHSSSSPRMGHRKFAGSTNSLSLESSASPSLTSSSSFSSATPQGLSAPMVVSNASLPPQPSNKNNLRQMSRSFKSPGDENQESQVRNKDVNRHQRSSSYINYANGSIQKIQPPSFANGFSHCDSSTLGRRRTDFCDAIRPVQNGIDHSIDVEGCQDEVDERRKAAVKLLDGVRRRGISQGGERDEVIQAAGRTNSYNGDDIHDTKFLVSSPELSSKLFQSTVGQQLSYSIPSPEVHPPPQQNSSTGHHKNVLPLACRRALEAMTQELNDLEPGFTVRRTWQHAKEEEELVKSMRQVIESHLNVRLPENPRGLLKDGVILCRLVNHCFPHTIPLIHAPNHPTVGLSVAKCRLNVDNFLVSCQMVGLEKSQICSAPAILDERNLSEVARTVLSLVNAAQGQTAV